jgi:hypothetical protein
MTAVRFFITTLSVSHPDLEEGIKITMTGIDPSAAIFTIITMI